MNTGFYNVKESVLTAEINDKRRKYVIKERPVFSE